MSTKTIRLPVSFEGFFPKSFITGKDEDSTTLTKQRHTINMKTLFPSFEDFLKDIHAADYIGTDDDMPDAFDKWLENCDIEFLLKQADNYASTKVVEMKKNINRFMEEHEI